ncbi:guanyl nucleotide exchange factor [Pseudozyma hubeiensis SY62]|uniref:Guanyl nucleotide exchange factor n=1 Tax=Pseudozyma hubeiensis (strain SY62) TaxID=1305764 RepID=R9PD39_PSEHS|nr:guanyl nucleotide exchange factor [Pseudozyma hubeiensis SY62]GAC99266.1 guanyl nucleotide exchange factor [Pseudozyma hubeiensis SY62]
MGYLLGWQLCSIGAQIASLTLCFFLFWLLSSNEQALEVLSKDGLERIDVRDRQPGRRNSTVGLIHYRKSTGQHSTEPRRTYGNVVQTESGFANHVSSLKSEMHSDLSLPREANSAHQPLTPMSRDERDLVLAWLQTVDRPELGELRTQSPTSAADVGPLLPLTAERLADHVGTPKGGLTNCQAGSEASSCWTSSQLIESSPFTSVVPISSTVSKGACEAASAPLLLCKKASRTPSDLFCTHPGSTLGADTNANLMSERSHESGQFIASTLADSSSFSSRQTGAFPNVKVEISARSNVERTSLVPKSRPYPIGRKRALANRRENDDDDIEDMAQVDQSTQVASRSLKKELGKVSVMDNNIRLSKLLTTTPRAITTPTSPSHELRYHNSDDMYAHISDTSIARGRPVSTKRLLDLITKLRE